MTKTKLTVLALICALSALPFIPRTAALAQPEQAGRTEAEARRAENQNRLLGQLVDSDEATTTDEEMSDEDNDVSNEEDRSGDRAQERRSTVANAVQELLQVADRTGGIGEQIREVARMQEENSQMAEDQIKAVKNRGRLLKFFFGPDYRGLKTAEERIANQDEKLTELKQLADQVTDTEDAEKVQVQIQAMEQVNTELKEQLSQESQGFSLFGWLNRLLSK